MKEADFLTFFHDLDMMHDSSQGFKMSSLSKLAIMWRNYIKLNQIKLVIRMHN